MCYSLPQRNMNTPKSHLCTGSPPPQFHLCTGGRGFYPGSKFFPSAGFFNLDALRLASPRAPRFPTGQGAYAVHAPQGRQAKANIAPGGPCRHISDAPLGLHRVACLMRLFFTCTGAGSGSLGAGSQSLALPSPPAWTRGPAWPASVPIGATGQAAYGPRSWGLSLRPQGRRPQGQGLGLHS